MYMICQRHYDQDKAELQKQQEHDIEEFGRPIPVYITVQEDCQQCNDEEQRHPEWTETNPYDEDF